jgi:alanyl-tRNA synthetase
MGQEEWSSERVRREFVEFFMSRSHGFVPSSSVVPVGDPTLLFTNSGMVQFKPYFLDSSSEHLPFGQLTKVCNYQRCIRMGGKLNDFEQVGCDGYHHTFFEMLGNWSFGKDNFDKRHTLRLSWELLTQVYGLDKDRIYVTYFEGDKRDNVPPDNESKDIWNELGVRPQHILPFGPRHNFWEMGDTGPCGPCTEIHYDRRPDNERETLDGSQIVNMDHEGVTELWNIVFMEYRRKEDGDLQPLPEKHVDTGMGLERLVSVLQRVPTNYDTDLFKPLLERLDEIVKNSMREPIGTTDQ